MDPGGDGGGGLTATGLICAACGTEPPTDSKLCNRCGASIAPAATTAEYTYRDYRDRYRTMATSLGFEGHIAWAEAMP